MRASQVLVLVGETGSGAAPLLRVCGGLRPPIKSDTTRDARRQDDASATVPAGRGIREAWHDWRDAATARGRRFSGEARGG